ncbi:hypothetical protein A2962_01015 [Candidatus Woesebacteria bacterium RIFCSPLOWO2_01_FULL_39_61]|uniref:Uncharacterized protein n=1 Tax=Candidatus Woesebacteria bacterium RIFCSPHIGHO2_02_FULL_39_13 TaxID=1802505 RepID=A0A1F7YY61_9BACT|nr:MAG: hypothetical protein A2692_04545 [Candidatus Woesebacteria bacterium RIFCSPHIGHO2_01_FULL_39_95]OGM32296.1 MAG: hypothetical protein A3D01_06575 [Candidatus Woesebacteria bacterium RIFCSPHIGHO2_02_FULL_39_13]OGM37064.1 MAG: hypothetical protein A3E13_00610 [Candidatus Woesebacteria bacterium RIFCSPHIGHO2_12_FULL_40_20]OGM65440.1 MAG: hypothetical protein A2962_01015 [Candidatus Woesebacteria bacterium RIFCSPLOWO2_01_FULL_39_61]OGM75195.1 MAG: hypothetical protein A3H19_06155 [Candidatus
MSEGYNSIQENHGLQPVDELNADNATAVPSSAYISSSLRKLRFSRDGGGYRTLLVSKNIDSY